MTTWVFDWEDYDGSRTFNLGPEYDVAPDHKVYVFKSGQLVGPFKPLYTPAGRDTQADDEDVSVSVVPANDDEKIWACDKFERGQLPEYELNNRYRSVLDSTSIFDRIKPATFFEEDNESDSNGKAPDPAPSGPRDPESLQDVFIYEVDAEGHDFGGATVTGKKTLTEVSLRGTVLTDTVFDEVTFKNVSLRDVDFRGADLSGATFTGRHTQLAGATFDGANLKDATFEVSVAECSFVGSQMRQADFRNAVMRDADFSSAKLKRARLDGTRPSRATFDGAILQNLRAAGATFEDTSFVGSDLENTTFDDAEFKGVNFTDATLCEVTFDDCTLRDVTFHDADASELELQANSADCSVNLDFERADLADAKFDATSFESARFDSARLSGAVFGECDLSGASLANVRANGADFTDANLESATLAQSDLTNARFEGARLYACQLDGVRVDVETRFDGVYDYEAKNNETTNSTAAKAVDEDKPHRRAASVYRTLEAVYRDNSLTAESLRYHRKRKRASRHADRNEGKILSPAVDWFMEVTTDHGTRLRPLVGWSLIIVLVWAGLHTLTGTLEHASVGRLAVFDGDTGPGTLIGYSLLFSILSFTGLGYGQFTPHTPIGTLLAGLETAFGILAFGLLIFVLSTRASR